MMSYLLWNSRRRADSRDRSPRGGKHSQSTRDRDYSPRRGRADSRDRDTKRISRSRSRNVSLFTVDLITYSDPETEWKERQVEEVEVSQELQLVINDLIVLPKTF